VLAAVDDDDAALAASGALEPRGQTSRLRAFQKTSRTTTQVSVGQAASLALKLPLKGFSQTAS